MGTPWRTPLDDHLRDAYLARLGWSTTPDPTPDTLAALHRAHVETIPYEGIWIRLGERRGIDPLESMRHLLSGRGGYCYQLNGAFATLLDWLGFDVRWHVAGVQTHGGEPGIHTNHLALSVLDADGPWMIDVGLGDALHDPLPLTEGEHRQGPLTFRLARSAVADGGWRFEHAAGCSFEGMDFAPGEASVEDFAEKHEYLSTSPESMYAKVVVVTRRDAGGFDRLIGRTLKRFDADGETAQDLDRAEWFDALADLFGLPLADVDDAARQALWSSILADDEARSAQQQ